MRQLPTSAPLTLDNDMVAPQDRPKNESQREVSADAQAALRLLEAHKTSGEPIRILTARHGILSVEAYELRGDKVTVCGTNDSGEALCTDHVPLRVFVEWGKKKTNEVIVEPPVPPSGSGEDSPLTGKNNVQDVVMEGDGGKPKTPGKKDTFRAQVGAADISEEIENRARDIAEEKMTREKEQLTGFSGWLSKTFKHNYGREIYRQIEIRKAREAILREGSLYAGSAAARDAHNKATNAIVDRIVQDYEEFIHKDAGEKREKFAGRETETAQEKAIKDRLTNIIKAYAADPSMSREDVEDAKKRIFHDAAKLKKTGGDGRMYADNVTEIAERLREHAAHAGGLANVDLDLDFTIAKAKLGARTEREGNKVDWALEKMRKLSGGFLSDALSNEIAVAVGAVYAVSAFGGQRIASSTLASWATFGASAGLAGVVAGYKEKSRMNRERILHERQRAVGSEIQVKEGMTDNEREAKRIELLKQIEKAKWPFGRKSALKKELADLDRSPRRLEMEQHLREKVSAVDMTTLAIAMLVDNAGAERLANIDKKSLSGVASGEIVLRENTPEAYAAASSLLAEIEARIRLSNTKGVDLLSYSDVTEVEAERRDLDYARALLKAVMRRAYDSVDGIDRTAYPTFDAYLEKLRKDSEVTLYGEKSMNVKKDKAFNKLATKKALWTGAKVTVGAMVIGGAVHEAAAFFGNGGPEIDPMGVSHSDGASGGEFVLPEGVNLEQLADGSSRMVAADGSVIADGLHTPGGVFDAASEAKLNALGIHPHDTMITIEHPVTVERSFTIPEWLGASADVVHAKRDLWYGNDTKVFDLNELKLWWGGSEQIGTNAHGDYVMSMSHMKPDWSFNTPESVDPFSALHEGKLKLLLSLTEGTQNRPVELDIDVDGNIVIPKDSDIAKTLFRLDDGKPVFLGRFAEIAEVRGIDPDGRVHYGILATHEGKGVTGMIDGTITINESIDKPVTEFDFENKPNLPPLVPIPVSWRTPLEPMGKRKGVVGEPAVVAGEPEPVDHSAGNAKRMKDLQMTDAAWSNAKLEDEPPTRDQLVVSSADDATPINQNITPSTIPSFDAVRDAQARQGIAASDLARRMQEASLKNDQASGDTPSSSIPSFGAVRDAQARQGIATADLAKRMQEATLKNNQPPVETAPLESEADQPVAEDALTDAQEDARDDAPEEVISNEVKIERADGVLVRLEGMRKSLRSFEKRKVEMSAGKQREWQLKIIGLDKKAEEKIVRARFEELQKMFASTNGMTEAERRKVDEALAAVAAAHEFLLPKEKLEA
ncbi:MAG: hypothetical protein UY72_C0012G0004 [Candidatus Uhrbacteria bacterium GW2011_GWD2_52_7]|uniref:Uncharacterized protein n=1 Tax=Candidatus Uhrbacteria bacterium GW2011_GWD2_52_7 TaxID=1618989 RepID=A0A0G2ADD4_9BACT|nr:MAG: hypothetical protein UY72_C0012G0004 [Candidatus Uhrbacteria bacterium GW2011_GWD2_52_7]